ncbi:MAG: fimbrillin family protein [Muribaculaceae bacterium]|nr:fimbrillin family protein [Muribaculaceae bacterium]
MYIKLSHILLLINIVCLLWSCERDAIDEKFDEPGSEMQFVVSSDRTRGSVTSTLETEGSRFALYGDKKSLSDNQTRNDVYTIFNNTPVSYTGNSWKYDTPQYWFPNCEYSFVALHPASTGNTTYGNSTLKLKYTIPDNFSDTRDIMASTHRRKNHAGSSSSTKQVRLNFFHILSKLNFRLNYAESFDKIDVSLALEDVNRTGTFSITPASLSSDGLQTDDCEYSWGDLSDKGTVGIEITVIDPNADNMNNNGMPLFPENDALFMIPQPDNKDITLSITCTIYKGENIEEYTSSAVIEGWEPGKAYTYSFTLQPLIKDIYIDVVSVKDWLPGGDNNIEVPRK